MNERKETRNKNILIGALLAIVLIMGVGYAAFSQQLTINGNASITSTWNVYIASITPGQPSGTASNVSADVVGNTQANFVTDLQSPGDSLTYTVTVKNDGTLPARIADNGFSFTESNSNAAISYSYANVSAGSKITANGGTLTFTVTVTYDDVDSQPSEANTKNTLTMNLNFEQDK